MLAFLAALITPQPHVRRGVLGSDVVEDLLASWRLERWSHKLGAHAPLWRAD